MSPNDKQQQEQQAEAVQGQKKAQKKTNNVHDAASALASLGDDESEQGSRAENAQDGDDDKAAKRFIPEHKKPDAALTFPEKLMKLMKFADEQEQGDFCVSWLTDGKSFVISNPDEFTRKVLPKYFKATKFSSFTRKLYRWGFRQVNRGIGPDDPIIFGNEFFQRDDAELMAKMRSVTAASSRKQEQQNVAMNVFGKRSLDVDMGPDPKRMMLEQYMQRKNHPMQGHGMYGQGMMNPAAMALGGGAAGGAGYLQNMNGHGMGGYGMSAQNMNGHGLALNGMKPYDMMVQNGLGHNPLLSSFQMHHQGNQMANQFGNGNGAAGQSGQHAPASSTADIVNAAINALRYA